MTRRAILKTIFEPFVIVVAAVYFALDALALSSLKPFLKKIANLKLFKFIALWVASLGPYPTLALFLIPLILLEPIKPLSAYFVASGQFKLGMLVLIVGEILKITIVERIFHIGREKLLTIKAFAFVYDFVSGWLTWIQALPPWQVVKHSFDDFIHWGRMLALEAFNSLPAPLRRKRTLRSGMKTPSSGNCITQRTRIRWSTRGLQCCTELA
jgi:hypothetical protein